MFGQMSRVTGSHVISTYKRWRKNWKIWQPRKLETGVIQKQKQFIWLTAAIITGTCA